MPITLTPAKPVDHACGACEEASGSAGATPAPVPCSNVGILSVEPGTLNGSALRTKMRAVSLQQGQCSTIEWTLHDRDGKPVDLTGCGFVSGEGSSSSEVSLGSEESIADVTPKVLFRMMEYIRTSNRGCLIQIEAEVVDPETGKVRVALPKEAVQKAGVYYAELAVVEGDADETDPCITLSNVFTVVINRGLFGAKKQRGAPTIAEVRLHLRDSAAAESYLLDGLAFDDAEIALAITRPIDYWNEVPPPTTRYTTENFPHRYHWLEAIAGQLFLMAEESYRRNQLEYSAGGISIDDMNKEKNYGQAAQVRNAAWREFVRQRKASDNIAEGFGELGSPYYH